MITDTTTTTSTTTTASTTNTKSKIKSSNVSKFIQKREYRQIYGEKASLFQEEWCRSKRSIQTLDYWKSLEGHNGCVNTINFSKSGDLLVSGSDDSTISIWDVETQKCLETLKGHVSNVFAADFLPYRSNKEIVSGGNDADMRYYDLEKKTCTVYSHHNKKVLRLSVNLQQPDTFLSCSADGTVRMIDVRVLYSGSATHTFDEYSTDDRNDYVVPQAFGGGWASRRDNSDFERCRESLVLDYKLDNLVSRRRRTSSDLYSVDVHNDGFRFIVGSAFGDVRLYDLRKIVDHNPSKSYMNIYRNIDIHNPNENEITGCVFSKNSSEIVATSLNNFIYVFDVNTNYAKQYNLDYFAISPRREPSTTAAATTTFPDTTGSTSASSQTQEGSSTTPSTHSSGVKTYKNVYKGHYSSRTIKGVNFYGPNSEFVISGSDDACIYIWDKNTTELLTILQGHDDIVNCIVGHPSQPMIASSGIDNEIHLWQNKDDYPSPQVCKKKQMAIQNKAERNTNLLLQEPNQSPVCIQQ